MSRKNRQPSYEERTRPSGPVQPGGTSPRIFRERKTEIEKRIDKGWLQLIIDQEREDSKRNYKGGEERSGGLSLDRAKAVAEILTRQAYESDKINAPRHAKADSEAAIAEISENVVEVDFRQAADNPDINRSDAAAMNQ